MPAEIPSLTRKEFLFALAGPAMLPEARAAASPAGKLLIVVAHPDDEYAFAATTYRLVRELGWAADQVIITDGEAGYRYSSLAEAVYGTALANERDGRAHLPSIRKEEAARAGKILGIRQHVFLDQKDSGFATDASAASTANWDRTRILDVLSLLLTRERYDAVFTLLPTAQTHGHHRAATELALEAVSRLQEAQRPAVFGVEARSRRDEPHHFTGRSEAPLTVTVSPKPYFAFDRTGSFGYHHALNYGIVANWVIAEHKSQGLFQLDSGRHELEEFWLFADGGAQAARRVRELLTPSGVPANQFTAAH